MKVLVVVDMQKDFVTGVLGSEAAQNIVSKIHDKILEYRANGDAVVFTKDTHEEDYLKTQEGKNLPVPHCIKGTDGWELCDGLIDVPVGEMGEVYEKDSFGYIGWTTALYKQNRMSQYPAIRDAHVTEIELVGVCTDICVVSNALILKALFLDKIISVDASCCAGTSKAAHDAALITMRSCQVNVFNS